MDEAVLAATSADPAPVHDWRRVVAGVLLAFSIAFTLTVALGFILRLGWSSDGSSPFDSEVTRWFVDRRSETWTDAMRVVTGLGSSWVVIPLAGVTVVVLLVVRQRWLALFVALSVSGASVLSVIAKDVVGRDRPPVDLRLQHSMSSSFPSGHSTQAAATYFAFAIVVTVLSTSRALRTLAWLGMLGSLWAAGLTVALAPLAAEQPRVTRSKGRADAAAPTTP